MSYMNEGGLQKAERGNPRPMKTPQSWHSVTLTCLIWSKWSQGLPGFKGLEPQMQGPGTEEHVAGDAVTPFMENTECLNGPSSWLTQVTELLVQHPFPTPQSPSSHRWLKMTMVGI